MDDQFDSEPLETQERAPEEPGQDQFAGLAGGRLAKAQVRNLELLYGGFPWGIRHQSGRLRTTAGGTLMSVEQMPFSWFRTQVPASSCLVCLEMDEYPVPAAMAFAPGLAFPILESLLGAQLESVLQPDREITELEQCVLEEIFTLFVSQLEPAWAGPTSLKTRIASIHASPERANFLDSQELVLAFTAEIRIRAEAGLLLFAVPVGALQSQRQDAELKSMARVPDRMGQDRLLHLLENAPVQLEVRLQNISIPLRNLVDLREGDVLTFASTMDQMLDGVVNGRTKFRGRLTNPGAKAVFHVEAVEACSGENSAAFRNSGTE